MARRVKGPDGITHAFPDDATDQEIASALEASSAPPPAAQPAWRGVAKKYLDEAPMVGGGVGGAAGLIAGGGVSAGLAAAPGAIMGAGLGGAAGAGVREIGYSLLGERPPSPASWDSAPDWLKTLGRLAGAGNEQMVYQAAGEIPAVAARAAAPQLMRGALRPTAKMLSEFSDLNLPKQALDRGIGTPAAAKTARQESAREARRLVSAATREKVTPMTERTRTVQPAAITDLAAQTARDAEARSMIHRAAQAAEYTDDELLRILRQERPNTLDLADAAKRGLDAKALGVLRGALGNLVPEETVRVPGRARRALQYGAERFTSSQRVQSLRRELSDSSLPEAAKAEVQTFLDEFERQHANRKSPIAWYRVAQRLQRESKPFYGRQSQGTSQAIASSPDVMATKAALAGAIKDALGKDISGLTAQDANTRVLIALERAFGRSHNLMRSGRAVLPGLIGDVVARSTGHSGLMEIPAILGAAGIAHAATSPGTLGRAALFLDNPAAQDALRQSPRGLGFGMDLLTPRRNPGDTP